VPDSAHAAYLFQCQGEDLYAVSRDKAGANIPTTSCTQGWLLRQEFQLDAQDPVPVSIEPDTIIRAINANGCYIWRDPCWAQRTIHWLAATTPLPLATGIEATSTP
jgi:hypothetical protein